jgi:two-component system sensor histidine kinase KdpD
MGLLLRGTLTPIDVSLILLLAVVIVGVNASRRAVIGTAVLAIAAFDFLFVPPYMTFGVEDGAYLVTFGVMAGVGLVMGQLTARLREQRQALLASAAVTAELRAAQDRDRLRIASEQLRTALLSSLSHDLRTPLAAIEGAASTLLLDRDAIPRPEQEELLAGIHSEVRRMHRLVANLLDMVRVEAGELVPQRALQPVDDVIGVVLMRLDDMLVHHCVTVSLPDSIPPILMDELLIEQVFVNLLENAVRHAPHGSGIAITVAATATHLEVTISDEGRGVPPGLEEEIFTKFSRGHAPVGEGIGLGLAICRGIVTAHGGWIVCDPVPPAAGGTFRFGLPLVTAP